MAGTVTDIALTLPLTNQTQQPTAAGTITGTGTAMDGNKVVYVVMVDKTNPGAPVDPARDATLTNVLGAVAHGTDTLITPVAVGPSSAQKILSANTARKEYTVVNPSNTANLYIGPSTMTSTVYKLSIPPLGTYINDRDKGDVYALSSSGSISPNVTETV